MYFPSSELGLSQPLAPVSPASVPLPPDPGGGGHSPAGEGLGESQFRRLEKKLSILATLCKEVIRNINFSGVDPYARTCTLYTCSIAIHTHYRREIIVRGQSYGWRLPKY